MAVPITSSARAVLQAKPRPRKSLEIISDLYNADLRQIVDVSEFVHRWATLTGASTIKSNNWQIPSWKPSLSNLDGRFSEGVASSVWAELGKSPDECWVRYKIGVDLPNGTREIINTYYGIIIAAPHREESGLLLVDLETLHAADEALKANITKSSGDELQVLGGW